MRRMMRVAPDGYTLGKLLYAGRKSELYEAVLDADGSTVVLKRYATDRAGDSMPQVRREFEAMRRVETSGIPRALMLDHSTEHPLLVLERVPGVPLALLINEGPLALETWLGIAIQSASVLSDIHAAHVIHKDLKPSNIMIERSSGRVWVCDFGVSAELGSPERSRGPLRGTLEGTLPYIAPEQTGRMNRGCDFRSDLYSLGATLYHAITGRPPFESSDPLELIHAHIARVPPAPSELRPGLPEPISWLIQKLLRKEPEERYQSARALHADLLACQEELARTGSIGPSFVLGSADAPERPHFAPKLHGRERETALLYELYARAASGSAQLLWIEGEPGAGKSALVDVLCPKLAASDGYLAVGKFDLYRERSYGGWAAALGSLVQQLLIEDDVRLERRRIELCARLGSIAQVLVDLIPDLGCILGDVPPVPPLGPRETQARLSLALQRFVASCATPEHPLVLFLDDLQWGDAGSLALLEALLSSGESAALLLIGAYRPSGVDATHPFNELVARLKQRGVASERLELAPLPIEASLALLADALEREPEAVRSLAELIERKTGNSPLLVRQFVEHVHARGLLRYLMGTGWTWDPVEVAAVDIPDGAVAFMTAKIDRLEPEPRALLQFASCVGDEFDTDLLCELSRRDRDSLEQSLYALADAGLIVPCSHGFRFVHDRIREAVHQLLSEDQRARIHYDTARLLLERIPDSERQERALEIVEHLNRGMAHVPEELRLTAIQLNHQAGTSSLKAGAAVAASVYFSMACSLLREQDWEEQRALGFSLFLQGAESALQNGQFEAAEALLDALDRRSPSRFEFTQIAVKRIQLHGLLESPQVCAVYLLTVLRQLGVRWPLRPSRLRARIVLRGIQWMLLGRNGTEILRPATAVDPRWLAPILVVGQGGGILVRHDVHLTALATCLVLRRYIRRGYIARAAFTVASYANWLHIILGDFAGARRFAQIALAQNERVPDPLYGPRCEMQIYGMLYPWLMPRRQPLAQLDRVAKALREIGDVEYSYYTRFLKVCYGTLAGDPVPQSDAQLRELADSVRRSGHRYPEAEQCHRAYVLLTKEASAADLAEQVAASDAWIAAHPGLAQPYTRTMWLLVLCVHARYDLAFAQSELLDRNLLRITPFVHVADHTFYRGLAAAALGSAARGRSRRRYRRELRRCIRRLSGWAKGGPDFAHMATLLGAERARLRRDFASSKRLYEQAALRARQQSFPHHAALAHERRGRMLAEHRRETEAASAFKDAIILYREWGALAKAETLAREIRALAGT